MSKINIHRDEPQASDEQLLKHKNFDAVLNSAAAGSAATVSSNKSFWTNPLTWIGGVAIVTGTLLLWNMNTTTEPTSETISKNEVSTASASNKNISESLSPVDTVLTNTPITASPSSISNEKEEIKSNTTQTNLKDTVNETKSSETKLILEKPDGEIFQLSSDFNLTANFIEFESYDQVHFQPLETVNPAYYKTAWDSAFLKKTEVGYELILHKNNKEKTFDVKPTL